VSKAKKEPVLCTFCNHEKRFHVRGTGPCERNGIHCVIDCRKFQALTAAKVKYPYVIYLQHKEEVGRVVAEDVYAESKHTWQCAKRDPAIAKHYPKELWDVITKEQFELLLMTAAERAKVEAKTPLPLPRKIFLQHKDRPNDLIMTTLCEDGGRHVALRGRSKLLRQGYFPGDHGSGIQQSDGAEVVSIARRE